MDSLENKVELELTVAEERALFEKEKLSRRQALARIGFQAGAALVATLTADDLLQAVGKEMQRRSGVNKIVQQVAKELSNVGVANAVPLHVGDVGFDPGTICGTDCIATCTPSTAFTCESCYFWCAGLSYPAPTDCRFTTNGMWPCDNCCVMQFNWCNTIHPDDYEGCLASYNNCNMLCTSYNLPLPPS